MRFFRFFYTKPVKNIKVILGLIVLGGFTTLLHSCLPKIDLDSASLAFLLQDEPGGSSASVLPSVNYSGGSFVFAVGNAVSLTPTITGLTAPTTCSIAPPLPASLAIDNDCVISGTPAVADVQPATSYMVTVTDALSVTATASISIEIIVIDTIPPTVVSSTAGGVLTPNNLVTGILPNSNEITVTFDEPMDTTIVPMIVTEDVSLGSTIASTGTTFSWSPDERTLTIHLSWVWFPENIMIRYTLDRNFLKDQAGNSLAADWVRSFTTTSLNSYFKISDTDQTFCYTDLASFTCNANPADATYPNQDGHNPATPAARNYVTTTVAGDAIVTDTVSGLIWKQSSEAAAVSWPNAINACQLLNTGAGYASITTWRLPTRAELQNLAKLSTSTPGIDTVNFPGTPSVRYWSSTSASATQAFPVHFQYGVTEPPTSKGTTYNVRCVSGGLPPPVVRFADNFDGTITDTVNQLVWQKCTLGETWDGSTCTGSALIYTWQDALFQCDLTPGGWRLPNINELDTILDVTKPQLIDTTLFQAVPSGQYWSSTTTAYNSQYAWKVLFANGSMNSSIKSDNLYARCVTGP